MDTLTVRLPGMLAQIAGGPSALAVRGATVREALDDLVRQLPVLAVHLFDESGSLRRHVICFHNEVHTRGDASLELAVRPGDTITILHSVAGG